jgi:hypothetical protein
VEPHSKRQWYEWPVSKYCTCYKHSANCFLLGFFCPISFSHLVWCRPFLLSMKVCTRGGWGFLARRGGRTVRKVCLPDTRLLPRLPVVGQNAIRNEQNAPTVHKYTFPAIFFVLSYIFSYKPYFNSHKKKTEYIIPVSYYKMHCL